MALWRRLWAVWQRLSFRVRRMLTSVLMTVLLVALTVSFGLHQLLYSEGFAAWVLSRAIPTVNEIIPGEIRFTAFHGTLGEDLVLDDFQIVDERGFVAAKAKRLALQWDALDLLARRVDIQRLRLDDPVVYVRIREDGTVNFKEAFARPGKKKKKERDGPVELPVTLDVRSLELVGGRVEVILGDEVPTVVVEALDLEAVWSMRDLNQDFVISKLEADLRRPVDLGHLSLHGSGSLNLTDLSLDDFTIEWGRDRVVLTGDWPRVGRGVAAVDVAVERLDLAHLKAFSEKIPLARVVRGDLRVHGPLSDFHITGGLDVEGGGHLQIDDAVVRIARGRPLGHALKVDLEAFPLRSVVTVDALPEQLTGRLEWEGEGTKLPTLKGEVSIDLRGFDYREFHVEPTVLKAGIENSILRVDRLDSGVDGLSLRSAGDVDLEEGRFTLDTDVEVSDLSGVGRALRLPLEGGSVMLSGRQVGSWRSPGSPFVLQTDSTISGRVVALGGLAFDGLEGDWTLEVALGRDGRPPGVSGTVEFRATEMTLGALAFEQVTVRANGTDTTAIFEVVGEAGEARRFTTNGRVQWADVPTLTLDIDTIAIDFDGEKITGGRFKLVTRAGRIETTPAAFELHPGSLEVGGVWDPTGVLDLKGAVSGLELRRLAPFLPETLGLAGWLEGLTIELSGTRAAPQFAIVGQVEALKVARRGPFDLSLSLESGDSKLKGQVEVPGLAVLDLAQIPITFRLDGERPVVIAPGGVWGIELDLPRIALQQWTDRLALALPEVAEGGAVRGRVVLSGRTTKPELELDLDVADVQLAERGIHLSVGASLKDHRLVLRDTHVRDATAGTVFQLNAEADTAIGEQLLSKLGPPDRAAPPPLFSNLAVEGGFRRLPLEILHALAPALKPLQGALKGRVALTGELANPGVGIELALLGGTLGERALRKASLALDLTDGRLSGGLEVVPEAGGKLTVTPEATVPLALDGSRTIEEMLGVPDSLKASVRGDGFPLDVLLAFIPGILEADGAIVLKGAVTGSILRPEPNIDFGLSGARVCYTRTSICYENIDLRADFTPQRLRLLSFDFDTLPILRNPLDAAFRPVDEARAGGLSGKGQIALDGWRLGRFDLELTGDKTWLLYSQEMQMLVNARLGIHGPWPAIAITGDIDVLDLKVDMGSQDVQRTVQPMVLPESLRVHRPTTRSGPGERDLERLIELAKLDRPPTFFEQIEVDVEVDLGLNNRVRLAYGVGEALARSSDNQAGKVAARSIDLIGKIEPDIRPAGKFRIQITDGVPRLQGRLEVQRNSKLKVLSAKFNLDPESNVEFGGMITDSALSLRAVHTSRFGDIVVMVGGTLANPTINFESDTFESQADMLAVLLTGRPLSEHSAAEGNATTRAVSGALSGFTTKLLDKVVPLDIFEFDLGDDISSGSVEAGKALGPRVVVITRWRWGGEDDENRVEAEVEVLITRGLYFKARGGDRAEGSVDVVYKERF